MKIWMKLRLLVTYWWQPISMMFLIWSIIVSNFWETICQRKMWLVSWPQPFWRIKKNYFNRLTNSFSSSELITKLSKQKLGKNCKRKTLPLPPRCWIRPCSNCKEFTKKCFKNSRFAHQTVCSSFGEKMCYVIKSILILIANFIFPRSRHYYIWFTLLQYLFI